MVEISWSFSSYSPKVGDELNISWINSSYYNFRRGMGWCGVPGLTVPWWGEVG